MDPLAIGIKEETTEEMNDTNESLAVQTPRSKRRKMLKQYEDVEIIAEKRKRGQNFSFEEKEKLIKLLLQHKDTILNKKTDWATNEAKHSAWTAITNSFNSPSGTHRNKESLMKMWEKLKSEGKRYAPMTNNTTKIDPILDQVCGILGRGGTGSLRAPDSDPETGLDIFIQNSLWQTVEEENETIETSDLETQREEISVSAQPQIYECMNNGGNLTEEPKAAISSTNERSEASSVASSIIKNGYKRKETVEDLKVQLLREELEFKRKLNDLQLQAAAKDVEIKNAILHQIRGGGFNVNNLFGIQISK